MTNFLTLLKGLVLVGRNDFGILVLPEERDWPNIAPVQIWQLCREPREDDAWQGLVKKGLTAGRKIFLQTAAHLPALSTHGDVGVQLQGFSVCQNTWKAAGAGGIS